MASWTEKCVSQLKLLHEKGFSATVIAKKLGSDLHQGNGAGKAELARAGGSSEAPRNRRIYFDEGSAEINDVAKATLQKQADWLARYKIKIEGFASEAHIVQLSLNRFHPGTDGDKFGKLPSIGSRVSVQSSQLVHAALASARVCLTQRARADEPWR